MHSQECHSLVFISCNLHMSKEEENRILKAFSNNVRTFRESSGLSQEKLAEKADLHRTYIGSIERSEKMPSLITVVKIAKALNINISQLINY